MSRITVGLQHLEAMVLRALKNLGLDEAEAQVVAKVLMYAEKRASSQGLIKITERTILPDADCSPIMSSDKTKAIVTLNGGGHTGMFVLYQAMLAARSAVEHSGIALVNTCNTRSSTGAIGYYAGELADAGYIAIILAGSPKVMAVEGGIDPLLGTNPVAIAIPTTGKSIVFDSATAAITWFSVINARNNQQLLPEHVAIDHAGDPTCEPVKALSGALRTIAGAKGSGLAIMFEFLTASLAGASIAGNPIDNRANTIICIDPRQLLDNDQFYTNADSLIETIKSSRSADRSNPVRLPGEASDEKAAQCEAADAIVVEASIYSEIMQLAQ